MNHRDPVPTSGVRCTSAPSAVGVPAEAGGECQACSCLLLLAFRGERANPLRVNLADPLVARELGAVLDPLRRLLQRPSPFGCERSAEPICYAFLTRPIGIVDPVIAGLSA